VESADDPVPMKMKLALLLSLSTLQIIFLVNNLYLSLTLTDAAARFFDLFTISNSDLL